jgi:hypothetical protein
LLIIGNTAEMSRPKVFFDITIGGKAAGRIVMEVCNYLMFRIIILAAVF